MRLLALTLLSLITLSTHAIAKDIVLDVEGMFCESCAQTVKQVFTKDEQIKDLTIDLENAKVTLSIKEDAQLSDEHIKKLVDKTGFELTGITRGE